MSSFPIASIGMARKIEIKFVETANLPAPRGEAIAAAGRTRA